MSWLWRLLRSESASLARPAAVGDPQRVQAVERELERLRPLLQSDGGDVELVAVEHDTVRLRLRGACRSCSAADQTLEQAIAPELRARLDWVRSVESVF